MLRNKNKTFFPVLAVIAATIVLISVTVVLSKHFFHPSMLETNEKTKMEKNRDTFKEKPSQLKTANTPNANRHGHIKSTKVYSEEVAYKRFEDESKRDTFSPGRLEKSEEYSSAETGVEEIEDKRLITKAEQKSNLPYITKNSFDSLKDVILPSEPIYHFSQTVPPNSWKPKEDISILNSNNKNKEKWMSDDYFVSISREIVSRSFDDREMDVTLSININGDTPNGLIVQEYVPNGWDVVMSIPIYRNFNPSSREMKWLFIGSDIRGMEINYKVVKRETSIVDTSFNGTYLFNNRNGEHISKQVDGATHI